MTTDNPSQYDSQYFPGTENRLIRYYFYLMQGLKILNEFRNLFLGIIAIYFALSLTHWWLLPLMAVPSILILMVVGYYATHKLNKITEWLSIRFSSHYAMKQFNLQQEMTETLKEIREKL